MVVSVPYVAGEALELFKEFTNIDAELPEFQQEVTYRRFVFKQDPLTGDLDASTYTDYTIYATVDILETEKQLTQAGELQTGDAEIWLPARIRRNSDGTTITNEFRPQINDWIVFNNITYRIDSLSFNVLGQTETFAKATARKMQDSSTVSDVTTVPYVAGEILDLFNEYLTTPEFQQTMTYRHFTFSKDPMTGDLDLSIYADYTIYGSLDVENIAKVLLPTGELTTCDVTIWLRARLEVETDGTAISPQVRPTINDYIIYDNVTYRIAKITFYMMGTNEMFAKIGGVRLSSSNPVVDWNTNYNSETFKVGGGYS